MEVALLIVIVVLAAALAAVVWWGQQAWRRRGEGWRINSWFTRHGGATVLVIAVLSIVGVTILGIAAWDWLTDDGQFKGRALRDLGLLAAVSPTIALAIWRNAVGNSRADIAHMDHRLDSYQRAVELLAHKQLPIRVGAIFALRDIAQEHPSGFSLRVFAVMCSFVQRPPADTSDDGDDKAGSPTRADTSDDGDGETGSPTGSVLVSSEHYTYDSKGKLDEVHSYYREPPRIDVTEAFHAAVEIAEQEPGLVSKLVTANKRQYRLRLEYAKLAKMDLRDIDLSNTYLLGADFQRALLTELKGAVLVVSDLSNAKLMGANLTGAKLMGANLMSANLNHADLRDADLSGADLSGADLPDANLSNANLWDADLTGARFASRGSTGWAKGLTQRQLNRAVARSESPPKLDGVVDAETGRQLVWVDNPPRN